MTQIINFFDDIFLTRYTLYIYIYLQLMGIEYLKGKYFNGTETFEKMKPISSNDKSGAQLHVVFMKNCGGGHAFVGDLCRSTNDGGRAGLSINCHGGHQSPLGMAQIVSHEIGHNLGEEIFCHSICSLQYRQNGIH